MEINKQTIIEALYARNEAKSCQSAKSKCKTGYPNSLQTSKFDKFGACFKDRSEMKEYDIHQGS